MVVAERQREKRASSVRVRKSLARHIAALEKELPVIDRDIDTMVRGSPLWREKEDLLVTFPGVGNTIARSVLADVPELGRLDRRKIASLIGVAPFTRRSGKWKGKSMIGGGRPAARSAIFLAALSAIRCNPVLRAFYQRLLAQGKPKMVALIAVARKIVTILNAMLRDKKQWQPAWKRTQSLRRDPGRAKREPVESRRMNGHRSQACADCINLAAPRAVALRGPRFARAPQGDESRESSSPAAGIKRADNGPSSR